MAMEIFKLVGSVMVDSDKANESLQKTDKHASSVGQTLANGIGTAAKWGAALIAGAGAVAVGLTKVAVDAAGTSDQIDKASQRMKISAESYQELGHAAGLCGVEMSTMEQAAKKLEGTDLNFDDAMASIYELGTAEERSAKAAELFGEKIAYQMTPMLNASGEEMANMKKEARDLGLVLSDDTVKSGAALNDSISKVKDSIGALVTNLGASLMPIVQAVCEMIISFMPQIQSAVSSLAPVFSSLLSQILPLLMNLASSVFPLLVKVINTLLPLLVNLVKTILPPIISIIQALLPPLLKIISSVLPIVVQLLEMLLPPILQIVDAILPILLDTIMALLPILEPILGLIEPLIGILMALIQPLLQLIGAILPPIAQLLTSLVNIIAGILTKALQAITPLFTKLGEGIRWVADQVQPVINALSTKFNELKTKLSSIFESIRTVTVQVWDKIKTAITNPIETAKTTIKKIVDTIKDFFSGMHISFPKIKLPHFKVQPSGWEIGDLLKGSIPKLGIEWYAKAMDKPYVFTEPTVVGARGFGEAGDELVYGKSNLMKDIESAVNSKRQEELLEALVEAVVDLRKNVYGDMVDALESVEVKWNGRELGRLVQKYA